MRMRKQDRQQQLIEVLEENPFLTDEELAHRFQVSVQTVRLDRLECGIPELRKRLKDVAAQSFSGEVKSLDREEIIGEIIDMALDERAISLFDVTTDHVFQRNGIARGHHLFAQANSLAVAVLDDALALTAKSTIEFLKPVHAGDRVIARAQVCQQSIVENRTLVEVESTVHDRPVFRGSFYMYRMTDSH